ncbi:hypothetical protein [Desulfosporosinus sp. OT]|uniref:hypothetical protein n=1 Tax=Desulfosporosinus sp. OT TaxID=913865 RepID=UPI000223AB06|nr:hypothetical protein [Desulfosporosinus sp. OT]EGW36926.1 hypothetical protein DOT_5116 [Desulfosporosinus sp. OT]
MKKGAVLLRQWWERAYGYRDSGSVYERARESENIFQKGTPLLDNYASNMNN